MIISYSLLHGIWVYSFCFRCNCVIFADELSSNNWSNKQQIIVEIFYTHEMDFVKISNLIIDLQ